MKQVESIYGYIINPKLEAEDPHPDIHALFLEFNQLFFNGRLSGIEVRWSKRMTLCAGICSYEGRGGLCSVALSQPILKFRSRKELIETLLHEMIHAYLFVTENNRDRDGHGPNFLRLMKDINEKTGCNISVYHNFHDEVAHHRKHVWKCNGPCQNSRPYFGIVMRAMNRPPSPTDRWWARHQASCGGTYIKVSEPEGFSQKNRKKIEKKILSKNASTGISFTSSGKNIKRQAIDDNYGFISKKPKEDVMKIAKSDADNELSCPVCTASFSSIQFLNDHLDKCLSPNQTDLSPFSLYKPFSSSSSSSTSSSLSTSSSSSPSTSTLSSTLSSTSSSALSSTSSSTPSSSKIEKKTADNKREHFEECFRCEKFFLISQLKAHQKNCKGGICNINNNKNTNKNTDKNINKDHYNYNNNDSKSVVENCPVCFLNFSLEVLPEHVETCLLFNT